MKRNIIILACVTLVLSQSSCAQKENIPPLKTPETASYTIELVVPDVEVPWGMVFLPNGSLLYTEKEGKLIRFQYGKKHEISGLPTPYVRGQGGLMGIALHPDFEQNNSIYFTMATANEDASGGNTGLYTAKEAIYSYGHRNPQGMVIHPETGAIWAHEHGPRGGDEINIIEAGKNYGWPKITYGKNYSGTTITKNRSLPGMEQPFYYWVPSIAASGMAFITSDKYPNWKGSILAGSLKKSYLERLTIRENNVVEREKVAADIGRVRDVIIGPYGYIHIAVEFEGIYRITPLPNS